MRTLKSVASVVRNASGIAYTATRIVTDTLAATTEQVLDHTNSKLAAARSSLEDVRATRNGESA